MAIGASAARLFPVSLQEFVEEKFQILETVVQGGVGALAPKVIEQQLAEIVGRILPYLPPQHFEDARLVLEQQLVDLSSGMAEENIEQALASERFQIITAKIQGAFVERQAGWSSTIIEQGTSTALRSMAIISLLGEQFKEKQPLASSPSSQEESYDKGLLLDHLQYLREEGLPALQSHIFPPQQLMALKGAASVAKLTGWMTSFAVSSETTDKISQTTERMQVGIRVIEETCAGVLQGILNYEDTILDIDADEITVSKAELTEEDRVLLQSWKMRISAIFTGALIRAQSQTE